MIPEKKEPYKKLPQDSFRVFIFSAPPESCAPEDKKIPLDTHQIRLPAGDPHYPVHESACLFKGSLCIIQIFQGRHIFHKVMV